MMNHFITFKEVKALTGGLSRSTIFREERLGRFPKRRQISPGRVGWVATEINEWLLSRKIVISSTNTPK